MQTISQANTTSIKTQTNNTTILVYWFNTPILPIDKVKGKETSELNVITDEINFIDIY